MSRAITSRSIPDVAATAFLTVLGIAFPFLILATPLRPVQYIYQIGKADYVWHWAQGYYEVILVGLLWSLPVLGGAAAWNVFGSFFNRTRMSIAFVLLAFMYVAANFSHLRFTDWFWLHSILTAQLFWSGCAVPRIVPYNLVCFGLLCLALFLHFHTLAWQMLDGVWATYLSIAAVLVQRLPFSETIAGVGASKS